MFEKKTGYFVKTIAVGSGQAMAMGQKGEADVLLVHSPAAEKKFVVEGFGINRRLVMHNDFIIVGRPTIRRRSKGRSLPAMPLRKLLLPGSFSCRGVTIPEPTPRRKTCGKRPA